MQIETFTSRDKTVIGIVFVLVVLIGIVVVYNIEAGSLLLPPGFAPPPYQPLPQAPAGSATGDYTLANDYPTQ